MGISSPTKPIESTVGTTRVAGCDLGKAVAKFAIASVHEDGSVTIESTEELVHEGKPLDAFRDWYERAGIASCAAVGATGLHADELIAPIICGLPESACLEESIPRLPELADGPLNVVSVGARGYGVLTRSADGRWQHIENDKCSSGTGETMVKIAGRFGLSIEEADCQACAADKSIPITARCSVFAKSEMTHFGNQGRPADQLFRGYFGSVANYVAALLARARVDGPVVVVGGGSRIRSLCDSLGDAVGEPVVIPEDAICLEAIGAALLAAEQSRTDNLSPLPADADELIQPKERRIRALEPARNWAARTERMQAQPIDPGAANEPTILGLDLGSTGSKAVLTSIETGDAVLDLYDRTRGNPVDAASRLISKLLEDTTVDVRAIGVTGSGREAVATVMRAAFPDMADRISVVNEIVAHATAAIRCDEHGGEDLSVVEIGGQDAKFIQIVGGQIVESDMNKACSAGTGSFLEEQAVFYGIRDIEEFTRMAMTAERPPELGQMCTVFVAEAAAEAHNEGYSTEDLFAGFQYSVIHNYINRVMGQRTFGKRIFFQGKPATGPSLAWTLAAVTGRDVIVPPNPGAMGAWGIGLCAIDEIGADALLAAPAIDLRAALAMAIVGRKEIQCRDKKCATLCVITKTKVEVGDTVQTVVTGGACPKYEISTATRPKLAMDAPSAIDERAALLEPYLKADPNARVAIPMVGSLYGYIPWVVTLLRELEIPVQVLQSDSGSLARGEERCYSFDACAPVKIAHGVVDADASILFFPKLVALPDREGPGGTTCPMEQGLPDMVGAALRARGRDCTLVSPTLSLRDGFTGLKLVKEIGLAAGRLGGKRRHMLRAVTSALRAQDRYEDELARIGHRTLRYGRDHDIPVIAVCGSLHVIHDPGVNAGIPRLVRENGALALPMDCFPIPAGTHELPRIAWAESNRALRCAVAARERGGVYPLLLSSFGCGPGSFGEQFFAKLMEGYPFTTLESDGHGGTAGYVTRVQAFLHTVREYAGGAAPVSRRSLRLLEPLPDPPIEAEIDSQLVMFSFGDRVPDILAASFRAHGFDAVAAGPNTAEVLAHGRKDCSGKECVPYQVIWGAFRQRLEDHPPEKRTVLMQVQGEGRCRNCMFSVKDQISLERMGLDDKVALRHYQSEHGLGFSFLSGTWVGVSSWDLLVQLAAYYRPYVLGSSEVDDMYEDYCDQLVSYLEKPPNGEGDGPGRITKRCSELLTRASWAFSELAHRNPAGERLPTVYLSGDIYVRLDEFSSDSLIKRLNQRGLRVIVEPSSAFSEYLAEERMSELMGLPTSRVRNFFTKHTMKSARRDLQRLVSERHRWLPMAEATEVLAESKPVIGRYPQGEAPVTIGSVLHQWRAGACDGVVVVSPWGCAPALISESMLRHRRDIPMLFVYCDGTPVDERRLNAFAFRLRRQRASAAAAPAQRSTAPGKRNG